MAGTAGYNLKTVLELSRQCNTWGKWGVDNELGTLNYITPEKIKAAAKLVKQGKVFSLAIPFDDKGPQAGGLGRFNPIHVMLQDGGDIVSGAQDHLPNIRYTDDAITMPLQCATQWDALAHILHDGKMWNGYDARLIDSTGAKKNSIDKMKAKIVSRGLLFDMPRYKGKQWLDPGEAINPEDLEGCATRYGLRIETGDILLVRTGQLAQVRARGSWGDYAGGDAPGLSLICGPWLHKNEIAGVATDTWGMEVRPNETPDVWQPLHIVVIVNGGLLVGEIFNFEELAEDCAKDSVYEFMFVAPPLTITGAVGSPVNPQAIK